MIDVPNYDRFSILGRQFTSYCDVFFDEYRHRRQEKGHPLELPLEWRGWRMSLVHLQTPVIILSYPSLAPLKGRELHDYRESDYPDMPNGIDDIAKFFGLGEVIGTRNFAMDTSRTEAMKWAIALADEHIANTSPSFTEALTRMGRAYGKLFELEQTLRVLVQGQLERIHPTDWWSKVPADVQNKVIRRESDSTANWFDDFSPSRLKFADFDDLRRAVLANWQDFRAIIGDRELFHSNMAYLSHDRDRIAHVNTLSSDDYQDFVTLAERLLKSVRPHVQLQ